jgi:hypothetical protein
MHEQSRTRGLSSLETGDTATDCPATVLRWRPAGNGPNPCQRSDQLRWANELSSWLLHIWRRMTGTVRRGLDLRRAGLTMRRHRSVERVTWKELAEKQERFQVVAHSPPALWRARAVALLSDDAYDRRRHSRVVCGGGCCGA